MVLSASLQPNQSPRPVLKALPRPHRHVLQLQGRTPQKREQHEIEECVKHFTECGWPESDIQPSADGGGGCDDLFDALLKRAQAGLEEREKGKGEQPDWSRFK